MYINELRANADAVAERRRLGNQAAKALARSCQGARRPDRGTVGGVLVLLAVKIIVS